MFTGLIQDVGRVVSAEPERGGVRLRVATAKIDAAEFELGESVAVSGVCLTVVERSRDGFTVVAGQETVARTTIGELRPPANVNLERAMRVGDRLGGHWVQGHVDGLGILVGKKDRGANVDLEIRLPRDLGRYVVEKGSIAIDGISLTVNRTTPETFAVALIPHTVAETTLAAKAVGSRVNLEVDILAKYVERMSEAYRHE